MERPAFPFYFHFFLIVLLGAVFVLTRDVVAQQGPQAGRNVNMVSGTEWPGGDPFPMAYGRNVAKNVPWPLYGIVTTMDYDTPNMQVYQWNLSLQKQIGSDWLVSATYLGNQTIHLWGTQAINPAVFIPGGPCTL